MRAVLRLAKGMARKSLERDRSSERFSLQKVQSAHHNDIAKPSACRFHY
jgi:hypothetical protein